MNISFPMDVDAQAHEALSQVGQQPLPHQPVDITGKPFVLTGGNKERGPVGRVAEYVQPTEPAPHIPPEVEKVVEVSREHLATQVTPAHHELGIEPAKESVPVVVEPTGTVTFPATLKDAKEQAKKLNWKDARKWILTLFAKEQKEQALAHDGVQ